VLAISILIILWVKCFADRIGVIPDRQRTTPFEDDDEDEYDLGAPGSYLYSNNR
jgi:hypothetical protein